MNLIWIVSIAQEPSDTGAVEEGPQNYYQMLSIITWPAEYRTLRYTCVTLALASRCLDHMYKVIYLVDRWLLKVWMIFKHMKIWFLHWKWMLSGWFFVRLWYTRRFSQKFIDSASVRSRLWSSYWRQEQDNTHIYFTPTCILHPHEFFNGYENGRIRVFSSSLCSMGHSLWRINNTFVLSLRLI